MRKFITEQDKNNLRNAMPEVLRDLYGVTDLRRNFRCPSPDHEDRTPSASYDKSSGRVRCFGCGGSWDVFDLVGMHDGIGGFVGRAEAVASIVGYRLEDEQTFSASRSRKRAGCEGGVKPPDAIDTPNLHDVSLSASRGIYAGSGEAIARDYMLSRGFDDYDIARYGIGFTSTPSKVMPEFRVYEPDALGFITIPYFCEDPSHVNYIVLRTIEGDAPCVHKVWKPSKYKAPLWHEWMLTAGLREVLITEGVLDAMALEKMTGKPCVALGGTTFIGRLRSVLAYADAKVRPLKVVTLMDNDAAGRKAEDSLALALDELGIPHASASHVLGECKDANDMLVSLKGVKWEFGRVDGFRGCPFPMVETRWFADE